MDTLSSLNEPLVEPSAWFAQQTLRNEKGNDSNV
jgi:hypothetical protein